VLEVPRCWKVHGHLQTDEVAIVGGGAIKRGVQEVVLATEAPKKKVRLTSNQEKAHLVRLCINNLVLSSSP